MHDRPQSRDPASPLQTCLRLTVMLTLAHASFGGARLALTLKAVQLQASPLAVGVLMSLLMVVPALVSVPIGRWADRAGHVPPTLAGWACLVAGEGLAAMAGGIAGLGAASVLVGTGYMLGHVSISHAVGVAAGTRERVRAFGVLALAFSVSALAGPLAAGWLIDRVGHGWTFALVTLPTVASALLMRGMPRLQGHDGAAAALPATGGGLLRDPSLRAVLITSAAVSMGWDLFTFLVPLHAARAGLSATLIGVVVGMFGVGSFTARLALPWLSRSLDEWKVLRVVVLLAAGAYLLLPFCGTAATLLPVAFAIGLVLGSGQPLVMSLLLATAPAGRAGEAVGLRSGVTSIGQTVLPLAVGAAGTAVGMLPMFWAVAATMAGCMALGQAGRRRGA